MEHRLPPAEKIQVDINVISFNRTLGSAGQASCWTLSLALLEVRNPFGAEGYIMLTPSFGDPDGRERIGELADHDLTLGLERPSALKLAKSISSGWYTFAWICLVLFGMGPSSEAQFRASKGHHCQELPTHQLVSWMSFDVWLNPASSWVDSSTKVRS